MPNEDQKDEVFAFQKYVMEKLHIDAYEILLSGEKEE